VTRRVVDRDDREHVGDAFRPRLAVTPKQKHLGRMLTLDHSPVGSSPEILGGTLVFKGTRVPAQTLLDYLADGFSVEEFLAFFPSVPREEAELFLALCRDTEPAG
jgi:uncharacterized protein (DUF433 family)